MARLRAALRHSEISQQSPPSLTFDGLTIDFEKRIVTVDGKQVRLTPKEFALLTILSRNAGKVVTHKQILTAVWGPAHTDDNQYLRVFIRQLRNKIDRKTAGPALILAEPGVGYRLRSPS